MARSDLYSNTITWVKVVLPILALALLSTLFLFASTPDPDAALPFADVDLDEVTREQRLSSPRFAGILAEGQELILVAETVSSIGGATDRLAANDLDGRMDLSSTEILTMQAIRGSFDMTAQWATLFDGVSMQTSDGYTLDTLGMEVAMNRVEMRSTAPVEINGPGLHLTAEQMELTGPEGSTIVHFTGSVRMVYTPEN